MSGIGKLRGAVALLAFACVVSPALVRADADTTPPVLTALSLPVQVLTGASGADVTVSARITDDQSGVAGSSWATACPPGSPTTASSVVLRSPSAALLFAEAFDPGGGDAYQAVVHLPPFAQAGTWTVSGINNDCAGNTRTLTTADLVSAGFPATLTVRGQGDEAPPTLRSLTIDPPSADNTAGPVELTVAATITDDLSGVAGGNTGCGPPVASPSAVVFRSPSGNRFVDNVFNRLGGDSYAATITVPAYAEVGTWTVESVFLADCAHNERTLGPAQLQIPHVTTSFQVTGVSDTTAPVVRRLSISPPVVDARAAGADVVLRATITDDISGVVTRDTVDGCATGISGGGVVSPSGDALGNEFVHIGLDDYTATVSLPRFAEAGTWTVLLELTDCAGNVRVLERADLEALGLPGSFRVLPPLYEFGGFMSPLDEVALAQRNAGSAMAVKFRLGGAQGLSIFDPGFPKVQPIDCATRLPTGNAVSLTAVEWRFQELTDGLYHYKWKSSPDWHDVCRRLILGFDDGSRHSADVHFA